MMSMNFVMLLNVFERMGDDTVVWTNFLTLRRTWLSLDLFFSPLPGILDVDVRS